MEESAMIDEETGESMHRPFHVFADKLERSDLPINNAETGEPEIGFNNTLAGIKRRRVPFQIPRDRKLVSSDAEVSRRKRKVDESCAGLPTTGTSFAQTNPIFLFLIAIVYFRWILGVLTIFEVAFHIWTHRKNKRLKDVFFRSPFHGVTSEFCALCQNENCMDKVGKIQQIRMHKFIRQCSYAKRDDVT